MRVVVGGGRYFDNRALLFRALDAIHAMMPISHLAHGAARGADRLAGKWAKARGIPCEQDKYRITDDDWARLGRPAGPLRNARMLDAERPDIVVTFPGGTGTQDLRRQAASRHIPVVQVEGI